MSAPHPVVRALPSLVTLTGLGAGVLALLIGRAPVGPPVVAMLLLVFAVVCDFCDGVLARALDARSALGRELDSLSDVVCFGVAPAALVYDALKPGVAGTVVAVLFVLAAATRLARFNVSCEAPGADPRVSLGLSAPMSAVAALASVCLELPPLALGAITLALAALMVSRVPYRTTKGVRWSRQLALLALLIGLDAAVVAIVLGPAALFALVALGYALVGPLGAVAAYARRAARSREDEHAEG